MIVYSLQECVHFNKDKETSKGDFINKGTFSSKEEAIHKLKLASPYNTKWIIKHRLLSTEIITYDPYDYGVRYLLIEYVVDGFI